MKARSPNNRTTARLTPLFIYLALSTFAYAQDDVIRVETNLVSIPLSATDRDGRFVTNLTKKDFRIFEDGVEQEIALFSPVEERVTVYVLLDVSGSMAYHMADMASAANIFVGQLRPDDQITAAVFADRVHVQFGIQSVREVRRKTFHLRHLLSLNDGRPPFTLTFDAVDEALRKLKSISGRKALVLFSDGVGTGLFSSAKTNLRDAEEGEALIYTVQFNTFAPDPPRGISVKSWRDGLERASNYMNDLALKSGGRHYKIEDIADLAEAFRTVAGELGRQYSLGYYPTRTGKDGEHRQIKVHVTMPNVAVRSRNEVVYRTPKK